MLKILNIFIGALLYISIHDLPSHALPAQNKTISYSLPINHIGIMDTCGSQTTLSIKIPEKFKPLQPIEAAQNTLEFIPNGEEPSSWSEIITINIFPGNNMKADEFYNNMKEMVSSNPSVQILEENSHSYERYQEVKSGWAYRDHGRQEILCMRYYSGPSDCCGIQYARAVSPQEDSKQALAQAKEFLNEISKVLDGKKVNDEWISSPKESK